MPYDNKYPAPPPCSASDSYYTITFTVPACSDRLELIVGVVSTLADADNYDGTQSDIDDVVQDMRDAIDLLLIGTQP